MKRVLAIIGYLLSVGFNIPHLVGAYFLTETPTINPYFIWVSMFVLDFGILVLAINDKYYETRAFAWIILLLNLVYYWIDIPFPDSYSELIACTPGLLFSIIPAFFVFYFSELISDLFRDNWRSDRDELEILRPELDKVRSNLEMFRPALVSNRTYQGSIITIDGTKATICKCSKLIKAGSNREKDYRCECGEVIEWSSK